MGIGREVGRTSPNPGQRRREGGEVVALGETLAIEQVARNEDGGGQQEAVGVHHLGAQPRGELRRQRALARRYRAGEADDEGPFWRLEDKNGADKIVDGHGLRIAPPWGGRRGHNLRSRAAPGEKGRLAPVEARAGDIVCHFRYCDAATLI